MICAHCDKPIKRREQWTSTKFDDTVVHGVRVPGVVLYWHQEMLDEASEKDRVERSQEVRDMVKGTKEPVTVPQIHDLVRPVFHRTTSTDVDNKIMIVTDDTRVALGNAFCMECGLPYPFDSKQCEPTEADPLDAAIAKAADLLREPLTRSRKSGDVRRG